MASNEHSQALGHVIRILDEFTIIVDVGSDQLSVGDMVQIYETGEQIVDLEGSVLGDYVYCKDKAEVIQVEDGYSICQKKKSELFPSFSARVALSPLLEKDLQKRIPLNVNKQDMSPVKPIDDVIHVGDLIKKC